MRRALYCSLLLIVFCVSSAAQNSVRQIEIDSHWGGLGTPSSTHLIIERVGTGYRLNGNPVDPSLVHQLVNALLAPVMPKPDPNNLGLTPEWCKQNAVTLESQVGWKFAEAAPNQKELFVRSINDPVKVTRVVERRFSYGRFDDNPSAQVTVRLEDGTTLTAKTDSYYAFLLPWRLEGHDSETYDARISRAVSALMPKDAVNRERLAGDGFTKEFAEDMLRLIETDWNLLGARNKAGQAMDQIAAKYKIVMADVNTYHGPAYGVDWDHGEPHETNLDVTVRRRDFPESLSESVILKMSGDQAEGADRFLQNATKYENMVLTHPLLQEYFRSNPKIPAWLMYVHDASFGDKAMHTFAADMHAIGKDDVTSKVHQHQSEIALVQVSGAFWLIFPDQHLLLWRFDGSSGLLRWKPETFAVHNCNDYQESGAGGCVGAAVSADGMQIEDYNSAYPCPPAPAAPTAAGNVAAPLFEIHQIKKDTDDFETAYINTRGEMVIPFRFHFGNDFAEGLAAVECAGKWGFIDTSGNWVIRPRFASAHSFSEGLARVQIEGQPRAFNTKWAFIDKTGTVVTPPFVPDWSTRTENEDFHDGMAAIEVNGHTGFIDKAGNMVILPKSSYVHWFSEGLAPATTDENLHHWGYIDKSGKMVIPAQFDDADLFYQGLAGVRRGDECGFIDHSGTFVLKRPAAKQDGESFCGWWHFAEGLVPWYSGTKIGYVDRSGVTVIPPRFDGADEFSEGLAAVLIDGKWGYIDKAGHMVIEPRFDKADPFKHGLAWVLADKENRRGFIDRTGNFVWQRNWKDERKK